jgi:predicted extracellular nuclease
VLVINEIDYDQPGSDTAEFVEIKNTGVGTASLDGVVLELVNGNGGAVYRTIVLPAVALAGGDFFVVCANAAITPNCDLDVSPDTNLVQNGAPDAARLMFDGAVLDAVSYEGEVPGAVEGSGAVADLGVSGEDNKGIARFPDGADADDNSLDFAFVCITPGNANTDRTEGCTATGPVFEIFEIQGAGTASPFDGQAVSTLDNVVTALDTNGFFIQTPPERADGDAQTSDGLFVFTGGAPTVAVGDRVDVAGVVDEFFNLTELTGAVAVTVASSGNPLPAAVVLDAATPSPTPQVIPDLERFEGMLVSFVGVATGPSDRFGDVGVVANTERAFREPGIEFPGLAGLPVWDGNPEVFEIDPDGLGGANAAIFSGQAVTAEGPLTFSFGDYQVLPKTLVLGTEPELPRAVRARVLGELTIASQNMLRFFDDQDDPATGDPVLSAMEFQDLLGKFSLHVRNVLDAPDVLAVQEVENLNVLEQLAIQIAVDGGPTYSSFLVEGNDVGGIDVGFMTRDDRIQALSVTQFLAGLTLSVAGSLLHDRPPLVLDAVFQGDGASFPFSVMVLHNRSLGGIDNPSDGPRVRQKRLEQSESIAALVQDIQTTDPELPLVVTGDFNAFQFTDGFVDVVGVIRGNPDVALLPGQDLVDPDLVNVIEGLDPAKQYSFIFGGSSQVLDHALVSAAALPSVSGVAYARGNADAPNALMDDATTPLRVSDHDGLGLFLAAFVDSDADGVEDDEDLCADTVIPESVPTVRLLPFRYALSDGDTTFDTRVPPHFPFALPTFTTEDTGGCSCEQIIDALHLGNSQRKFGCGFFVMKFWIRHVVN